LRAGMRTALVLTGVTQQADVAQSERRPDFVLPNLQELPGLLDRILAREA